MSDRGQNAGASKAFLLGVGSRELIYVFLMGCAVALSFARSVAFGAGLGPEQMGYYAVATSIAAYGMFFQLGVMNGLNRELPIRLGAGGTDVAANLVGLTTTSLVVMQGIGFLLYVVVLSMVPFDDELIGNAFLFGGVLALSAPFLQLVFLRMRALQLVVEFAALQALTALLMLVFGYWAIPWLAYRGPILAIVMVNVLTFFIVTLLWLQPANYLHVDRSDLVHLIRVGAPLMLAGVVTSLMMGMDRLFLIKFATPSEVGIYQMASMPMTLGIIGSGILGQYVGPKLLFDFGANRDLSDVYRRALKSSLSVAIPLLLLSPLVTPLARLVFDRWLPEYVSGLDMVLVFYVSGVLIAANVIGIVLSAADQQFQLLVGSVGVTVLGFGIYVAVSREGRPLIWYAYANLAIQAINYGVVLWLAHRAASSVDPHVARPLD
ncbi:MAG: hypothetical protein FJ207_07415 [Gemmatimonadetes bacterium]|nr:hypothetical protein [Gemmatimonadota bacterium]